MDEIKVVPYIPDEDYDNPAMVVDFYEFTMANCLFLHGFKDTTLVFDMFFRKNPDDQGYSISAGQRNFSSICRTSSRSVSRCLIQAGFVRKPPPNRPSRIIISRAWAGLIRP